MRPVGLTIAGSDSGGGAGIVADVRTFTAHGVWPAVAVTAVTAQNTLGVQRVALVDPDVVRAQIASVLGDLTVRAAKTGMLGCEATVSAVAATVAGVPLVVDPVVVSTSGTRLLDDAGLEAMRSRLLPVAAIVTPNLAEAAALTGRQVGTAEEMEEAARRLVELGCSAALVTGGHLGGDVASDCLVVGGAAPVWLRAERVVGTAVHGTGCVLSAAIAAGLALGASVQDACGSAKSFVTRAIASGAVVGAGPASADPG